MMRNRNAGFAFVPGALCAGLMLVAACAHAEPKENSADTTNTPSSTRDHQVVDGIRYVRLTNAEIRNKIVGKRISPHPSQGATTSNWYFKPGGELHITAHQDYIDGTYVIRENSIVAQFSGLEINMYFYMSDNGELVTGSYQNGRFGLLKKVVTDIKIKGAGGGGVFPVRWSPNELTSGESLWLLDVVAPDKKAATAVLINFRNIAEERQVRLHSSVSRSVDPEVLRHLRSGRHSE